MGIVLITGGAGFVGSHIALNLLKKDYTVIIFDSFINSSKKVFSRFNKVLEAKVIRENLKLYKGDLREEGRLKEIFMKIKNKGKIIDAVIHCAGLKAVNESYLNSLNYWDVNVAGTISLIKVMNKFSCKNLIFSSSATVYDSTKLDLLNESSKLKPTNPYGNTKYVIEKFLKDISLNSKNKWNIINLRYFNPIGADPDSVIGESPASYKNNIYPLILDVALRRIDKFVIFGNDWNTPDGTCVRDYVHIMDLADGHIAALDYLKKSCSQIINLNLGTGKGTSVLELINTFSEVNNVHIPYSIGQRRIGDNEYVVANNEKASKLLNWFPKRSIKDMCIDGWNWKKRIMSNQLK